MLTTNYDPEDDKDLDFSSDRERLDYYSWEQIAAIIPGFNQKPPKPAPVPFSGGV